MKIGIIVSRFQTPYLHEGHVRTIQYVFDKSERVIIFLGTRPTRLTTTNPLSFEMRKQMVLSIFPQAEVYSIADQKYNERWSQNLDSKITALCNDADDVILYGGRDSFIKNYHGNYPCKDTGIRVDVSSTRIREEISKTIVDSQDFRKGIVYASAYKFPTSYQTVDVAIVNFDNNKILLGKKETEGLYRFIGGFVDPSDSSLELAAKREVAEECGHIETDDYKYIGSYRIDSWRYRDETDKMITAFFCCHYIYGRPSPMDDISELQWFDIEKLTEENIEPTHHILFNALKKYLQKNANTVKG